MSMKKLEDIIKTVTEKGRADDKREEISLESTCSKEGSRLLTEYVRSAVQTNAYKNLRNHALIVKADQICDKKVVDCKVRPGTPRKELFVDDSLENRRVRQLERTISEL